MPHVIEGLEGKQALAKRMRWQLAGKIVEHHKGHRYVIETFACRETDGEVMVVYRTANFDHYWIRPLSVFNEQIVYANQNVPRFRVLDG